MGDKKIITKEVLKAIAVAGVIVGTVAMPTLPMAVASIMKTWKDVNKKDLGRIIKRLEKQQMISIRENGDKISIEMTEKGKRRLLEYDFENIQLKAKKRDGKWRIIIFDIPENKKRSRDAFRRKLLEMGLVRWQDSVFVSAFPCKNEIDFLTNYLEISDYVTMATLGKIERGEQLIFKKYYDGDNDTL